MMMSVAGKMCCVCFEEMGTLLYGNRCGVVRNGHSRIRWCVHIHNVCGWIDGRFAHGLDTHKVAHARGMNNHIVMYWEMNMKCVCCMLLVVLRSVWQIGNELFVMFDRPRVLD